MASPAKKSRSDGNKSKNYFKSQARKGPQNFIEAGDQGFLVTCNFKERDATKECYKLLNEYYKGDGEIQVVQPDEDDDDIAGQLKKEIEKTQQEVKERNQLFTSVTTGVQNLLFIRSAIGDPTELGVKIMRDLAATKLKKTKFTLRMLPIAAVTKTKMEDITNAAGELFDKHFLKEPCTFAINFNKRYNHDTSREEVINELAALVSLKNPHNKVNLKEPQKSVVVEVVKGLCMIAVVPDYLKLKKYNLHELMKEEEPVVEAEQPIVEAEELVAGNGNEQPAEMVFNESAPEIGAEEVVGNVSFD